MCRTVQSILAGLLTLVPALATGADQALPEIRAAVQSFLEGRSAGTGDSIEITVGRLDRRLRLPDCPVELEPFPLDAGRNAGNLTIGVRCDATKRWTVYVPARVSVSRVIAVAARTLAQGSIIARTDVRFEARDIARYRHGYFIEAGGLVGMQLTRTTTEGNAFTPTGLARQAIVRRGTRVVLLGRIPGMEIRAAGEALADGARGERVRVRNLESQRVVEGVVVEPGLVKVLL